MAAMLASPCSLAGCSRSQFAAGSRLQQSPTLRAQRAATPVLAMAKPMRAPDARKLSAEEVTGKVQQLKEDLFRLRMAQSTRQDFKGHEFKKIRREVARLLTVQREREIEKGVTKRESRRLARAAAVINE